MVRALIACFILVSTSFPALSCASSIAFDPGLYVNFNSLIFEGEIVSVVEAEPNERIEGSPGWFYQTNKANVVVARLVRQTEGPAVSNGDTLCFRYRTSAWAQSPDSPNLVETHGGRDILTQVEVGRTGLFSLRLRKEGYYRRGAWFELDESQEQGVLKFISELEADFSGTVARFEAKFPNVRNKLVKNRKDN